MRLPFRAFHNFRNAASFSPSICRSKYWQSRDGQHPSFQLYAIGLGHGGPRPYSLKSHHTSISIVFKVSAASFADSLQVPVTCGRTRKPWDSNTYRQAKAWHQPDERIFPGLKVLFGVWIPASSAHVRRFLYLFLKI